MFVEERKQILVKYYLVHSYREGKRLKIREYLGNDLAKPKFILLKNQQRKNRV